MEFVLNPGRLTSLSSLHNKLAPQLATLSELYRKGIDPVLTWDLSSAVPNQQSVPALTALSSIVHLVSRFSGRAAKVVHSREPQLVSFWNAVGFIKITSKNYSLEWDPNSIPPFLPYSPHWTSGILQFARGPLPPRTPKELEYKWKDEKRVSYSSWLVVDTSKTLCDAGLGFSASQEIAVLIAELILNSSIHGRADAFIAVEATTKRITLSVCDSGAGFLRSLDLKCISEKGVQAPDDIDAILTGCLINRISTGLRGGINFVIGNGGSALISSGIGELRWTERNWPQIYAKTERDSTRGMRKYFSAPDYLGLTHTGVLTKEDRLNGYHHSHRNRLVGSRVVFEIPIAQLR